MPKENRAYAIIKKGWPSAHWQRIESWTGSGIFDLNGCYKGREIWIELKQGHLLKNGNVKCVIRPAQVAWQLNREGAGGKTFIAIMIDNRLHVAPGDIIFEIKNNIRYKNLCLQAVPLSKIFD